MHVVLLNARRRRIASALALVAVLGALPACGQNLGKSNFARTTVAVEAGSGGDVPSGDINDPAVTPAVMRTIDPCPLVGKEALSSLGTPEDPRPSSTSFGSCRTRVTDAGGKQLSVGVEIGASTYVSSQGVTVTTVEGLPQVERKSKDGKSCDVGIMTLRKPERGVGISVTYDGGDPCAAARAVAAKAVKSLHSSPAKYPSSPGTLTAVDPCTAADPAVLGEVVPHGATMLTSFHSCDWTPGSNPRISIGFRTGLPPEERDGTKKVEIDGVAVYQKVGSGSSAECKIEWQHKAWVDEDVEIVGVIYKNYDEKKDEAASCEKAAKVAKSVLSKLPKP
ncbi:hypothetical protein AVL48_35360 [Amycolatopsis regifaucium]|uniref:DUF3558 domain-containing protein n=1 Tax=Amycolatopsis regifaucium TaxID=546365 RepID=A0A154MHE4_9PSEU|nr:hypothetical protein AVL48_35360 [Amycolatopsis regifaucium]OKA06696.1 DUF3558 domain-containing protein [Amycolatopsis regifaucium]SFH24211.1 hypothetical protein SAMN04489731_103138 [Amycolatopsis regifaucium]